ncbi:hypothetical protein DEO72_LG1g2422 [Vigna unguiculata]|uniref:Uncharacterized protein n=1 Tax=Vigna unguiculata TaxID=3917 RepID=A0A4D6KL77_VIGUN|nr:hypothetical protein DEO72_LG1g2422 [Vigna unguiculata]
MNWLSGCALRVSKGAELGDEFSPGDSYHFNYISGLLRETAWRHERDHQATLVVQPNSRKSRQAIVAVVEKIKALSAWQYVSPARRSGSGSAWRVTVYDPSLWFLHVFYRLWPMGMAARHFEVLTRRCRTLLAWLWPCGRKGTSSLMCIDITWLWPCGRKGTSFLDVH